MSGHLSPFPSHSPFRLFLLLMGVLCALQPALALGCAMYGVCGRTEERIPLYCHDPRQPEQYSVRLSM